MRQFCLLIQSQILFGVFLWNGCAVEETSCHRAEGPEGWTCPEEKPVVSPRTLGLSGLWKHHTGQTTSSKHLHVVHHIQGCHWTVVCALLCWERLCWVMVSWDGLKMLNLCSSCLSTWPTGSELSFVFLCCYFLAFYYYVMCHLMSSFVHNIDIVDYLFHFSSGAMSLLLSHISAIRQIKKP